MELSVFDVIGPVMIGPSSSHTAGAARLARIASRIVNAPFSHVTFLLHGSFASTYQGHGTDRALVAGVLGIREDDPRLRDAFRLAKEQGLGWRFETTELDGYHENSVRMLFTLTDGGEAEVSGSSLGGGRILIRSLDHFDIAYSAQSSALITRHQDRKGTISDVCRVLANWDLNIGGMRVSRSARGETACCVIETDGDIPAGAVGEIRGLAPILAAQAVNLGEEA